MKEKPFDSKKEWAEYQLILKWFPEARIKVDYNREILDIGAEITWGEKTFILLRGDQTNDKYELITPECLFFEGLETLADVYQKCKELNKENVDIRHEMTREKGRNE
jgi:hypothetical protein